MTNIVPEQAEQLGLSGLEEAEPGGMPHLESGIAPWWHTLAVLGVLGFLAVSGFLRAHTSPPASDYLLRSISAMISQAMLTGAVIAGVYHRREFFRSTLLHGLQPRRYDLSKGAVVYLCGMGIILVTGLLFAQAHGVTPDRSLLHAMMPHNWAQIIPWVGVSACAGLGEELVFRGYLLQQATRWMRSARGAVILTSILFGVMHAYEGWGAVISLTALAVLYAGVTLRSGNLRAVAIAHFLQDLLTAMFFVGRHRF